MRSYTSRPGSDIFSNNALTLDTNNTTECIETLYIWHNHTTVIFRKCV